MAQGQQKANCTAKDLNLAAQRHQKQLPAQLINTGAALDKSQLAPPQQVTKKVIQQQVGMPQLQTMPATSATTTNHYIINNLNFIGTPHST